LCDIINDYALVDCRRISFSVVLKLRVLRSIQFSKSNTCHTFYPPIMNPNSRSGLPPGYSLHDGYVSVPDYLHLRSVSGLSSKTISQANAVSTGSWYGCYITYEEPGKESLPIGMGRIIGDGGWYFHIADMAVHPEHQRKGLGDVILKALLWKIHNESPEDGEPYITLFADEAGRKLYYKNGFVDSAPGQLGMAWRA